MEKNPEELWLERYNDFKDNGVFSIRDDPGFKKLFSQLAQGGFPKAPDRMHFTIEPVQSSDGHKYQYFALFWDFDFKPDGFFVAADLSIEGLITFLITDSSTRKTVELSSFELVAKHLIEEKHFYCPVAKDDD